MRGKNLHTVCVVMASVLSSAHAEPEIIVGRNPNYSIIRQTGDLFPDISRVIVSVIDRHQQPVFVDAKFFG